MAQALELLLLLADIGFFPESDLFVYANLCQYPKNPGHLGDDGSAPRKEHSDVRLLCRYQEIYVNG